MMAQKPVAARDGAMKHYEKGRRYLLRMWFYITCVHFVLWWKGV